LLSKLLGDKPSQEMLNLAVSQPHKILEKLLIESEKINDQSQLISQLANEDIEPLQNNPAIRELINVLESIQKTADKSNLLIKL
jgi:hypothetical protein